MGSLFTNTGEVLIKSLVAELVLFILARIMGKKQISQLTFFDYVVGISIGSLAANLSLEQNVSVLDGLTSMVFWTLFPLIMSYLSFKSMKWRKLLEGVPIILIQNGKIIEKNLLKSRFTINDLLEELRTKDVFNISDVEFAILETNGKISVLKKSAKQEVTVSDLKIPSTYQGLCANIIIDGKIMYKTLDILKRDESWLINELKKNNISSTKNVLLACLDTSGSLHIDIKSSDPKVLTILQ